MKVLAFCNTVNDFSFACSLEILQRNKTCTANMGVDLCSLPRKKNWIFFFLKKVCCYHFSHNKVFMSMWLQHNLDIDCMSRIWSPFSAILKIATAILLNTVPIDSVGICKRTIWWFNSHQDRNVAPIFLTKYRLIGKKNTGQNSIG
jgi:hypothetical protein